MNSAYLAAISALAGSAIGAPASFMTTSLTLRYQERTARLAAECTWREKLFGDFIEQASRLFADPLTHGLEQPDFAWAHQSQFVALLITVWEQPDEGVWEVRGGRRHFTLSMPP